MIVDHQKKLNKIVPGECDATVNFLMMQLSESEMPYLLHQTES